MKRSARMFVALTALERDVLLAYYSDFTLLPRPAVLAPRAHDEAARRLDALARKPSAGDAEVRALFEAHRVTWGPYRSVRQALGA